MKVLAWFEPDKASLNIRDRLLEMENWEDAGNGWLKHGDLAMVGYPTEHLYTEGIGTEDDLTCESIEGVVVLSRHRAESGKPALTVHPTGNFGKAEFGGLDGRLSVAFPSMAGGILRALKRNAEGLGCAVSLEVTHHGPLSTIPMLFVEIGSSEDQWSIRELGKAIARSVLEPDIRDIPVAIGIGGGHYAPRFTDQCASGACDFGHIVPNYQLGGLDAAMVCQMKDRSPGCRRYSLHVKDGNERDRLAGLCEEAGLLPL